MYLFQDDEGIGWGVISRGGFRGLAECLGAHDIAGFRAAGLHSGAPGGGAERGGAFGPSAGLASLRHEERYAGEHELQKVDLTLDLL